MINFKALSWVIVLDQLRHDYYHLSVEEYFHMNHNVHVCIIKFRMKDIATYKEDPEKVVFRTIQVMAREGRSRTSKVVAIKRICAIFVPSIKTKLKTIKASEEPYVIYVLRMYLKSIVDNTIRFSTNRMQRVDVVRILNIIKTLFEHHYHVDYGFGVSVIIHTSLNKSDQGFFRYSVNHTPWVHLEIHEQ